MRDQRGRVPVVILDLAQILRPDRLTREIQAHEIPVGEYGIDRLPIRRRRRCRESRIGCNLGRGGGRAGNAGHGPRPDGTAVGRIEAVDLVRRSIAPAEEDPVAPDNGRAHAGLRHAGLPHYAAARGAVPGYGRVREVRHAITRRAAERRPVPGVPRFVTRGDRSGTGGRNGRNRMWRRRSRGRHGSGEVRGRGEAEDGGEHGDQDTGRGHRRAGGSGLLLEVTRGRGLRRLRQTASQHRCHLRCGHRHQDADQQEVGAETDLPLAREERPAREQVVCANVRRHGLIA